MAILYPNYLNIHFDSLAACNAITNRTTDSLILGAINFRSIQGKYSFIREDFARSLGVGQRMLDGAIARLKSRFIISADTIATPFSKSSVMVNKNFKCPAISYERLNLVTSYTKDLVDSAIVSFIAYRLNLEDSFYVCEIGNSPYWQVNFEMISKQFSLSDTTVRRHIDKLIKTGFLEKRRKWNRWGRPLVYLTINQEMYNKISEEYQDSLAKKVRDNDIDAYFDYWPVVKNVIPSLDNNTLDDNEYIINNNTGGDVNLNNLDEVGVTLTFRQKKFLWAALLRTIVDALKIPLEEIHRLYQQVKYFIINPQQHKNVVKFRHLVNIAMKLIRNDKWRMPFGYHKYSSECKEDYERLKAHEKAHYMLKSPDALIRLQAAGELPPELNIGVPELPIQPTVEHGVKVDEKLQAWMEEMERRWLEERYASTL